MRRPPRSRAVRLRGSGSARPKAPLDTAWPTLILPHRLYRTSRLWWGCRTGSGLWCIDFDAKEDHLAVLSGWEGEYGPLAGLHVRSGNGGRHVWCRGPWDLPPRHRIPVEGLLGVELHANRASQVVWPSAPGYEPLSELPRPLPDAPAWLVEMAGQPISPVAAGTGRPGARGLEGGEISPSTYVPVILGEASGWVRCPAHNDTNPSMEVRADSVRCWVCGFTTRARGLLAITLGLGQQVAHAWRVDDPAERQVLAAEMQRLFPNHK